MTGTDNNGIGISILITNHNVDCRKLMTDLHGQMCRWGGIEPGVAFEDLPEDFVCPLCAVGKDQFSEA